MTNPLLEKHRLPPFSRVRACHVEPAITALLMQHKDGIDKLLTGQQKEYTWQNLLQPIEAMDDQLAQAWSPVSHLNAVLDSEELRAAYNACLPLLSEYSTWRGQHSELYSACQQIADSDSFATLDGAQQKTINHMLRDFRLAGVALQPAQKHRYGELKQRLSELSSTFSENVLDATNAWTRIATLDELSGLPPTALASARQAAQQTGRDGYLISLDYPSWSPVATYCDNAELREEVYTANCTRASELGPHAGQWDNTALITETLELRRELAQLLGFDDYTGLSLATKMAGSADQVLEFLRQLAEQSRPQALDEWRALVDFASSEYGVSDIPAWDVAYYSEKLRQRQFDISQEEIRPYLPVSCVLPGLFEVVHRLYGITVREVDDFATYHPDVRLYELQQDGEHIASFYLDLYARAHKRGGAWMDDCRVRRHTGDELQLPVAYLVCNFTPPVGDAPALLTHNELTTLFHEFGHGLHHMLTRQTVAAVSGINGVPWDAVELPSQFLENWCWQREALTFISGHHESGEPLPQRLLDKLLAARNFQSAMTMMRQLEFALFDFRLHRYWLPRKGPSVQEVLDSVRREVAVTMPPQFNRFQNSFSHIFAGGYAAGYYSYKWAEVLSADAFSRFEEEGIFNRRTGMDFRRNILEAGGSQEPEDLFAAFRGRPPEIAPLLRHSGIK